MVSNACAGACTHVPPCGTVRVSCVADANDSHAFLYSVGYAAAMGCEILVLNVSKADHPRPDGPSTIEVTASILSSLREDALAGRNVLAGQICACTPDLLMPSMILVAPRAADAARFFAECVTDHRRPDADPLLVLAPLTNVPAGVRAGGKAAVHDYIRDTVLPDFAASPPGAHGAHGRAGSAAVAAAFEVRQGA